MITPVPDDRVITANGEYFFDPAKHRLVQGGDCLLEIDVHETAGTFGGRTVTIGYEGESGNFVSFRDAAGAAITTTIPWGQKVPVMRSGRVAIKVDGGGAAPKLMVSAIPYRN